MPDNQTSTPEFTPIPGMPANPYQPRPRPGVTRAPNSGGRVNGLLPEDARQDGLDVKTPLGALPEDFTPEWVAAREALETASDALDEFDAANTVLLSERWAQHAETAENRYVAAIRAGNKPPARPRGGYAADMEDKRPAIVAEWYRLRTVKDKADRAAWALLVNLAPEAIPGVHAEIVAAGETYIAAQEAMEEARSAFEMAFNARVDLEMYAAGTDLMTGGGLPTEVVAPYGESLYSASVIVENAMRYVRRHYGDADTGTRFPAMRKVDANGSEFTVDPERALMLESVGATFIDGFPPESQIHGRRRGGRAQASDRVGPGDSVKFRDR